MASERWREVSPYLDRALELTTDELTAWLSSLRAEQPAVAADLEMLLGERDALIREGFLEDRARGPGMASPGGTIGPYRLVRTLGEGGMGIVYLAEQIAPIRREVALKVIKPGMDSKRVIGRFEAERQALAVMDHPCVSKVFDAGQTEDGRPFFVMEYVAGVPITEHCDRQALTTAERLELFLQVCDGVQHAHRKAIIHRDLKPSNVLVALHDGVAVPKVIDFGVAKATVQSLTEATLYTEAGSVIGTPDYMSPEQVGSTAEDVDTRTDVYALGVMLYELLVGALPFEPRSLRLAGLDGIRRMIREVEPPKPSTRLSTIDAERSAETARHRGVDLATLRRQLSGELDWIVMKALEKDRERRYGSPAELAADLARFLRHEPVLAGAPSAAYRARKFVRRNRFGTAAAAAATLALVGFAGMLAVQAHRISREAEAKRRVAEFLTELFEVSDPGNARGDTVTARELLDRGAARIRGTLADDPDMRTELMATMGTVYSSLGLYPDAELLLFETLQARQRLLGPDDPETLRSAHDFARLRYLQGRVQEAETLYRQTLEIRRRVLGPDHPDTLRSASDLARVISHQGRYQESEALARATLDDQRRVLGSDHRNTLSSMANLAWTYQTLGRYADAETLQRRVVDIRKRVLGSAHPDTLVGITSLAWTRQAMGRYTDSEILYREAIDIQKRVLGEDHPDTLRSMANLSNVYSLQRRYQEAEGLSRDALEIQRRVLGREHSDTLLSMNNLAIAYSGLRRYDEAARLHREILETDKRMLGPEHPSTLWAMNNLALAWDHQGRHKDAERLHRETLDIRRRVLGREHPDSLTSMFNLVLALAHQSRYEEAEALSRDVLDIQRRVLGTEHPKTLRSNYNVACLAAIRGARPEALRSLREAVAHGFSDTKSLLEDSDLGSLRSDPEFEKIVAAARENQRPRP